MIAARHPRDDVVDVDVPRVAAPRHDAPPAIAPQHRAPGPRRDRLGHPRRLVAVDPPQQLGVARRLRQLRLADLDRVPSDVVPRAHAVGAPRDRDLVHGPGRRRGISRVGARRRISHVGANGARELAVAQRREQVAVGERVPARRLQRAPRRGELAQHRRGQQQPQLVQPRGGSGGSSGESPRRRPVTIPSISRPACLAAAVSHAASVSTVATRVSSRAALYATSPADIAARSFGRTASASATRSRSRAGPGA
ncbi:MAG: hypothetical protein IPH80_32320 [Myxococcales bacterium]|nr:hypothetical protein [Myxococcales bacterium]